MDYHLLTHNILFLFGGVLNIVLPLSIIFVRRKNLDGLIVTFALTSLSIAVFQISQVFGVMAPDAETSRKIFMFNLCMMPINIFMTHWFLILIGKSKQRRVALSIVYISGIAIFLMHIIFPETYLLASVPKMYFPFYYNPGHLQWITRVWFNLTGIYYFGELLYAYRHEVDPVKKNRYLYVLIAILYAFIVGSTAILLVYNIQFDPMWSSFFGFFPLLLAYAVIRYQLLDVRFIIQRAFIYGMALSILVSFISFSNTLTYVAQTVIRGFPMWIVPLISSIIGIIIGVIFWNKLRESDLLKYEFITIIAHKFRTPLTQAKWTLEEMIAEEKDLEKKNTLNILHASSNKLIDLTGALVELTDTDRGGGGQYSFSSIEVCPLVQSSIAAAKPAFEEKHILFSFVCSAEPLFAHIDPKRMQFVLQTLLENAASYTPEGGKVSVQISGANSKVIIAVKDSGIGIAKGDMSRLFSKFYRTAKAKSVDTEGFGVGLYLAQSIAKRHGGKIEISSEGEGKGSTFSIVLPLVRKG